MEPLALERKRILVIVYGHIADTIAAIPAVRSLRAAYPSALIDVLALESAQPILGPCPYIDKLITWQDFRHKGQPIDKLEKLGVIASLAWSLKRNAYDATLVFHRSSGAMRKLAALIGSPIRVGSSAGGDHYTHPVAPVTAVESSRDENRRILEAIGIQDDAGEVELWTQGRDAAWAASFLGNHRAPRVGIHPGSDWSCQQWLPERFAEVARNLQAATGASVITTGTEGEMELEAQIVRGMSQAPVRACGQTSFGQFVELVRKLDLLISVNSGAAAIARAVGTPAVVLLGLEDPRYTGVSDGLALTVIQPQIAAQGGNWCEFGRWGVLSGCNSPMCRGLGGLAGIDPPAVTSAAIRLLHAGTLAH